MEEPGRKPCRKCLLKDMDAGEYFQNLYAYIDGLDDEIRADVQIYEERLERCRRCDLLMNGMCRACGCFVELRAVIAANVCPYEKW